jgi:hypothetical protein
MHYSWKLDYLRAKMIGLDGIGCFSSCPGSGIASRFSDMDAANTAREPEYDQDKDHQAHHPAKSCTAIAVVAIVTAAAEQQQEYNNNQQQSHLPDSQISSRKRANEQFGRSRRGTNGVASAQYPDFLILPGFQCGNPLVSRCSCPASAASAPVSNSAQILARHQANLFYLR